jgi:sugar phosphate isomerase/epimerase
MVFNPLKISLAIPTPDVNIDLPVALLKGTFEERLEKASRLGYNGIELMVARPAELNAAEISQLIRNRALQVSAVSSGAVYMMDRLTLLTADKSTSSRACTRLLELVDFAANVGAPLVTIGGFRGRLAWAGGAAAELRFKEIIEQACDHAADQSVLLAIEPLNRYETDLILTVADALAFIEKINSPVLGLLIDTFHANIEEPNPMGSFRQAMEASRLFHVHLGDSNRLPPGLGHFDFSAIIQVLRETGYSGYLSAEMFPFPNPDTAAAVTIQFMRQLAPGPVQGGASK